MAFDPNYNLGVQPLEQPAAPAPDAGAGLMIPNFGFVPQSVVDSHPMFEGFRGGSAPVEAPPQPQLPVQEDPGQNPGIVPAREDATAQPGIAPQALTPAPQQAPAPAPLPTMPDVAIRDAAARLASARTPEERAKIAAEISSDAVVTGDVATRIKQTLQATQDDQVAAAQKEHQTFIENTMQAEEARNAQFDALREQSRQRAYAIDPNKNRFQDGSNTAVALLGGFLEGFIRPGQPSQISKTVSQLVDQDVQGQLNLINKEAKNIDMLDDQEKWVMANFKTREEQAGALKLIKLDRIKAEMDATMQRNSRMADRSAGLSALAGIGQAYAEAEHKMAYDNQNALNGLISAKAASLNATTNSNAQKLDAAKTALDILLAAEQRVRDKTQEAAAGPVLNADLGLPLNAGPAQRAQKIAINNTKVEAAKMKGADVARTLATVPNKAGGQGVSLVGPEEVVKVAAAKITQAPVLLPIINQYIDALKDRGLVDKTATGLKGALGLIPVVGKKLQEVVPLTEQNAKIKSLYGELHQAYKSYQGEGARLAEHIIELNDKQLGDPEALINATKQAEQMRKGIVTEVGGILQQNAPDSNPTEYMKTLERKAGITSSATVPANADAPAVAEDFNRLIVSKNPNDVFAALSQVPYLLDKDSRYLPEIAPRIRDGLQVLRATGDTSPALMEKLARATNEAAEKNISLYRDGTGFGGAVGGLGSDGGAARKLKSKVGE